MGDEIVVRGACDTDMAAVASIVNHFIETTAINFRTSPLTAGEWRADWERTRERYPWLVACDGGETAGIAYAGPWKARDAYGWSAESTIYVAPGYHRRGIGRRLYQRLLAILDAQGYHSTIGGIALPNPASVALHEACGFEAVGRFVSVGYKLGRWWDVGYWQRFAAGPQHPPGPILPVAAVTDAGRGGGAE